MFTQKQVPLATVTHLFQEYHGYHSIGGVATYCFGVYEGEKLVAAYAWNPPPPGACLSVCPECPSSVLALTRMVAVPKKERELKHISKPLMRQMKGLIDRRRWPVLITYSDEGQGHTGYVYQCSGWTRTKRERRKTCTIDGSRVSLYSNGSMVKRERAVYGYTTIQRWEHWATPSGTVSQFMIEGGWMRVPSNKVSKSGNMAFSWCKVVS